MKRKEQQLLESEASAAEALLLLRNNLPPNQPQPSKNRRFKPGPVPPPPAQPVSTTIGFRSIRRKKRNVSTEAKAVETPCTHRSPDTPFLLLADSDPSSSGSDGLFSTPDILPLKVYRKTRSVRSPAQPEHSKFLLPDLNEPAPESQEPDSDDQ